MIHPRSTLLIEIKQYFFLYNHENSKPGKPCGPIDPGRPISPATPFGPVKTKSWLIHKSTVLHCQ